VLPKKLLRVPTVAIALATGPAWSAPTAIRAPRTSFQPRHSPMVGVPAGGGAAGSLRLTLDLIAATTSAMSIDAPPLCGVPFRAVRRGNCRASGLTYPLPGCPAEGQFRTSPSL